ARDRRDRCVHPAKRLEQERLASTVNISLSPHAFRPSRLQALGVTCPCVRISDKGKDWVIPDRGNRAERIVGGTLLSDRARHTCISHVETHKVPSRRRAGESAAKCILDIIADEHVGAVRKGTIRRGQDKEGFIILLSARLQTDVPILRSLSGGGNRKPR